MRVHTSAAESALLQVLWNKGEATIRELTDALYREGTHAQYATVQKLLERLESKRIVARDRGQRAHRFSALVSREEFLGGRMRELADQFFEGSTAPLVTALVRAGKLSKEDRIRLRKLLDELTEEPADRNRGKR